MESSSEGSQSQHEYKVRTQDKIPWTSFPEDQHQPRTNYFNRLLSFTSNTATELVNTENSCPKSRLNPHNLDLVERRLGRRAPRPPSSSRASQSSTNSVRKARKKERLNNGDTAVSEQTLLTKENVQKMSIHTSSKKTLIKPTTTKSNVESKTNTEKSVSSVSSSQTLPSPEAVYQMRKLEIEIRKHESQLQMKHRDANLFPILHTVRRNYVVASSFNKKHLHHIEEKIELQEQLELSKDLKDSTPLSIITVDKSNVDKNDLKRGENKEQEQPGETKEQEQPGENKEQEQNCPKTHEKNSPTTGLIQPHQLENLHHNDKNSSDLRICISSKSPSTNDNSTKNDNNPIKTKISNNVVSSSKNVPPNTIKQFDINGSAWSDFILLGVDFYGFFILTFPMESDVNKNYTTMKKKLNSFYSSKGNQEKFRFNSEEEISNGSLVIAEIKSNKSPMEPSSSPSTKYIRAKVFDIVDKEKKIYSAVGVDDFLEYILKIEVGSTSIFRISPDFTSLPSKIIMVLLNGSESRFLKQDVCKAYKKLQSDPKTKIEALVRVKKVSFNKVFKVPSVNIMTTSDTDLFTMLIDIHYSIINWYVSAPVSDSRRRKPEKKKKKRDTPTDLSIYQETVLQKLQERNYFAYL